MKILYFGGQKSGKTSLAIKKAKELSLSKPYYVATYENSYNDEEMQDRVSKHKIERKSDFITIEESKDLNSIVNSNETYLIDCLSMWILNRLDETEDVLVQELEKLMNKDANIIFVINDVGSGVIPLDKISRKFVDFTGILGQVIAKKCDEVYRVDFSISSRIK